MILLGIYIMPYLSKFYEQVFGRKNDKQTLLNGHLTNFNWFQLRIYVNIKLKFNDFYWFKKTHLDFPFEC